MADPLHQFKIEKIIDLPDVTLPGVGLVDFAITNSHIAMTVAFALIVLFLTAAPPGFPGWHHVNCQPESYWIERLAQRGWVQDIEATQWVRTNGGHVFSTRQGLVFVKSSSRP